MPAGRPKGSLNGTTAKAKAAIEECFEQLGGVDSLVVWAKDNKTDFYKIIYPKLLPLQVAGDPENPLTLLTGILKEIDEPSSDN